MACSTCNTSSNTCGCKDTPVIVPFVPQCPPDPLFPDPSPCSQTILDTCVRHRNYGIYNFGQGASIPEMTLPANATLESALQMLSLNPIVYDDTCPPPVNLHLSYLGATAIVIAWESTLELGSTYTLYVSSEPTFASGQVVQNLTTTSYTIANLTSLSTYYIKVTTNCDSANQSESAIIVVTTL